MIEAIAESLQPVARGDLFLEIRFGKFGIELHDRLPCFDPLAVLNEDFQHLSLDCRGKNGGFIQQGFARSQTVYCFRNRPALDLVRFGLTLPALPVESSSAWDEVCAPRRPQPAIKTSIDKKTKKLHAKQSALRLRGAVFMGASFPIA